MTIRDRRINKEERPIFTALTKAIFEFGKIDVLPSDIQGVTLSGRVFDRLAGELAPMCVMFDDRGQRGRIEIAGLIIQRGH